MDTNTQENLQSLSLTERDVLRCFWRVRRENRSPHISEIKQSLGCRHSGHIPHIVISLLRKGYLRDMEPAAGHVAVPRKNVRIAGGRYGRA